VKQSGLRENQTIYTRSTHAKAGKGKTNRNIILQTLRLQQCLHLEAAEQKQKKLAESIISVCPCYPYIGTVIQSTLSC
jgi:hypothetical protein